MQKSEVIKLSLGKKGESFPIARAVMAASFAAPLVSKVHCRSIVFHVYGLNSAEEELALLTMASSVWGNPKKLIYSYDDGFDYLAKKAAVLYHLPVCICSSRPAYSSTLPQRAGSITADENDKRYLERRNDWMFYLMLSNSENPCGAGNYKDSLKDTGRYNGNRWKTVFISTGKKPLSYDGGQNGLRSKAIELDAARLSSAVSAGSAIPVGSAGSADSAGTALGELASLIEKTAIFQHNYGSSGRTYSKYLCTECTDADFKADYDAFLNAILPYDISGKAHEAAVIALGEFYSSMAVFDLDVYTAWFEALAMGIGLVQLAS